MMSSRWSVRLQLGAKVRGSLDTQPLNPADLAIMGRISLDFARQ